MKDAAMNSSEAGLDPQWLELMYNNRVRVPEHSVHLGRWTESSKAARSTEVCALDIAYGAQATDKLDVFMPAKPAAHTSAGAPVLVFIHGGYWSALDKADQSFIAPAFTAAGACVVVPNYALCPAVKIGDITRQMTEALIWIFRNIARFGGDPNRITIAGHSAGGHLVAMLMTQNWPTLGTDLPSQLVKNGLSISGLFDLEPLRHTPFLKNALQLTPEQVKQQSPALLPAPLHGQLYSLVGGDESAEFLRQNLLIEQVWGKHCVPVCEVLPGLNHFTVLESLAMPSEHLHQLALDLLN